MSKYKDKDSNIVEAMQYSNKSSEENNINETQGFINNKGIIYDLENGRQTLKIPTIEGADVVNDSEYIVKLPDDKFAIYKPDVFNKMYQLLEE
jgi:hypothetical protein